MCMAKLKNIVIGIALFLFFLGIMKTKDRELSVLIDEKNKLFVEMKVCCAVLWSKVLSLICIDFVFLLKEILYTLDGYGKVNKGFFFSFFFLFCLFFSLSILLFPFPFILLLPFPFLSF